jgi:hypothetical protein
MPEQKQVGVDELRPGDRLGQDIMSGDQVLLRNGTLLQDAQIARIQRLGLQRVQVLIGPEPGAVAEAAPLPDFSSLASDDHPRWMSDVSFAKLVEAPQPMNQEEQFFAAEKQTLRAESGLKPLIDPGVEAELNKGLQTAFIQAATSGRIDLQRLDHMAHLIAAAAPEPSQDYFIFTDIARYGQHLVARSIMSSKVLLFVQLEAAAPLEEQLRAHLALQNAFALLPVELSKPLDLQSEDERVQFRTALLKYYNWLKAQSYVTEAVLEEVLMQFERYDGTGVPFGLSKDEITTGGQLWGLALAYADRVFSRPRRWRLSPHQAADELVRQSGSAFASAAVNRFLRVMGFFPNGSLVELNDGRLAIVVRQNERGLLKPVVRLAQDGGEELDLKANPAIFIKRQIMEY